MPVDEAFRRAANWPSGGRVGVPRPGEAGVLFDVPIDCPPWTLPAEATAADPDPEVARQQVQEMLRPAVVADVDEPQHDPSARLARLVDLRDLHCAGPGCSGSRSDGSATWHSPLHRQYDRPGPWQPPPQVDLRADPPPRRPPPRAAAADDDTPLAERLDLPPTKPAPAPPPAAPESRDDPPF